MSTVCDFSNKFASLSPWKLDCFDRVIFKGHLQIARVDMFQSWVDRKLKVRRKDYLGGEGQRSSARLVGWAKTMCERAGRPYVFDRHVRGKDDWALARLRESPIQQGLIAVLATMEACPTYKMVPGQGRPRFVSAKIPQRVLYYYFLDRRFGLIHVRVQTGAPFTIQVYVNGHNYLTRQLKKLGLGFQLRENAFVQLANPQKAQQLADGFATLNWRGILDAYAKKVNPLQRQGDVLDADEYYWVVDQAEFATDVLFKSKSGLSGLYAKFLEYAWLTFKPKDVLGFLGRKPHGNFVGEVVTDVQTAREPGARIKHRMKGNWLKMYDKFGLVLRVETVINQPREFKIYREVARRDGSREMAWCPLAKGVANLKHFQSHAAACNTRYLQALSHVDDPTPDRRALANLAEPKRVQGRHSAGFNPARQSDLALFAAVLDGDHLARGFRNRDVRSALKLPETKAQAARSSAAVGRLLKRLHVRGLIKKIPRTRRWLVTDSGRQILARALVNYNPAAA